MHLYMYVFYGGVYVYVCATVYVCVYGDVYE